MEEKIPEQSILPEDQAFNPSGYMIWRPENFQVKCEYFVKQYLGVSEVQFVREGKIISDKVHKWLIGDDNSEYSLSSWAFKFTQPFTAVGLVGKKISLSPFSAKKAMMKILD